MGIFVTDFMKIKCRIFFGWVEISTMQPGKFMAAILGEKAVWWQQRTAKFVENSGGHYE